VSENTDWKQKYRDSLQEMEGEEQRWRHVEQALRRLIGRLCAAGMGVHAQLDDELVELAAANRRHASADELETLAASLTTAVVAVDIASPVHRTPVQSLPPRPTGASRWDATCVATGKVLQTLRGVGTEESVTLELVTQLAKAKTDAELAAILEKTAELVSNHGEALARERLHAASVLANVTQRLEEVAGYLTESGDDARLRFGDSASLNETVMSQVKDLSAEVNAATNLSDLQAQVATRLEAVTQQVLDFRSREERRLLEYTGRADRMRARIADLERETKELHSKLDRERHGARMDQLTRLGNRKSFDERFAQELIRRTKFDMPVCMLLWDLDNFKTINDSYGHRAGDRVLQSVAACLMSGLRAEDFVARIGGEEFVTLLTGVSFVKAQQIADELRRSVEALRFHFRGTPVKVTVSCGLTELKVEDAPGAAFDRADAALYQAKSAGKNACIAA
jgi:diguanylate cyclase